MKSQEPGNSLKLVGTEETEVQRTREEIMLASQLSSESVELKTENNIMETQGPCLKLLGKSLRMHQRSQVDCFLKSFWDR